MIDKKVYVFNFINFQIMETIETYEKSNGTKPLKS